MCSRYQIHASGIDRLADGPEQPERREVVLLRVLGAPLHVRADRGRRGVEDVHLVALDDRPPAVAVGVVGHALVEDAGGRVRQRPVDDVAVPGDPADVGRAPVDRVRLDVEDVAVRGGDAGEVAAGRVDDPLRLRGRAARVEEVEEVLRVHRLARARRRVVALALGELVRPDVAAFPHLHVRADAAPDDRRLHPGRAVERLVGVALQRYLAALAPARVLGDQHLALHVVEPVGERVGAEAAEDDRVRRAEPGAGEHRDRQLRDHPHVDPDGRALADAERLERVREAHHLGLEVGEGDRPPLVLGLALPVVGDLVAEPRLDVAVDAVEADVELAAEVPLRVRQVPLVELGERLEPGDPLAALRLPELLEAALVDLRLRDRLGGELRRRRIPPLLEQERVDRVGAFRHCFPPRAGVREG